MPALYNFTCKSCNYRVQVVGGPSRSKSRLWATVVCGPCRTIVDVRVGTGALPTRCPAGHVTRPWSHPGRCPKCHAEMRRGTFHSMME